MNIKQIALLSATLAASLAAMAQGTQADADKLGREVLCWGAPKEGNQAGTIPAWTGNPKAPAAFKPGSGKYPNPFADDKPVLKITAANVAQYADKLSEVQKELFKRYPDYRMDVYPTRRSFDEPKELCAAAKKNVLNAKTEDGGVTMSGAFGALPFPFPKTGYEVMWNHLTSWRGVALTEQGEAWYVDRTGRPVMTSRTRNRLIYPYYMPGKNAEWLKKEVDNSFYMVLGDTLAPARVNGEGLLGNYTVSPLTNKNKSWAYQPGQRRVRLSPTANYDFPLASMGGALVYDDLQVFYGAMDRFDFKLVGKKEMYIPYNSYDLMQSAPEKALGKNFVNPDLMRWELHRVWTVEATLKEGFRHIYSKRIFYFDEDDYSAGMSDQYDMSGKLFRQVGALVMQLYDQQHPVTTSFFSYDLSGGVYFLRIPTNNSTAIKDEPDLTKFTPQGLQSLLQR